MVNIHTKSQNKWLPNFINQFYNYIIVINKIDLSPPEVVYSIALKSKLILTNDTGPGHIAALSNNNTLWIANENSVTKANILNTKNSYNFCNKFSISELYFVFKHSHIAISNDTGAMHLCDAAGTPLVGLFSTKELSPKWYPNNEKSIVIEDETNISNIDSTRVYEAINLVNS